MPCVSRLAWIVFAALFIGCHNTPTYYEDIKPILDGRCVECHSPGGVAPFSFDTYENATEHRDLIANAVESGRMPPWFATGNHQVYRNDPSLSPASSDASALVPLGLGLAAAGD